jgi:regulator of sigma E protease
MDFISGIFSSLWSVFLIVLFFGGSIFVHELGHFLAARRRGLRVERFSIGFGPAIWKWRGKDGVEYRLAWLPLGGYVALPQLADLSAIEGDTELNVAALPPVSYATKMIVFAAGAFFNVLFAFALACVVWVIGQQTSEDFATTRIGYVAENITLPDGSTMPSPARAAGLKVGDVIRAIDGETVKDWPELLQTLVTSSGMTVDGRRQAVFTIERGGKTLDLVVFPRLLTEDRVRKVGISTAYTPIVAEVPEKSYAHQLGLQAGDSLTELNHEPLLNLATIYDRLQEKPAREFTLTVRRNGQPVNVPIPADRPHETSGVFGASYRIASSLTHPDPFSQIFSQARMTFRLLLSLFQPHSDITVSKLSGPVGIGKVFWDASEAGFRYVLWIAILVNVNLAIFNLLPIPVLDGGQMLFATIARLRGRALPASFVATTQSIFMVLILTLILYVSVFDVQRIRRDARADAQAREAVKPADSGSGR